ncbi:MAG: type II secretion protein F [Microbacterium sp. SCN 70-200]|uniref:type II secretion system F family protein n=1 Tax=unclassified Microbacterium TaxID=2609290 RepID=UPI00086EDE62|nr:MULTISPECIES: type II secretion system F family protein [unclassified Microbacterium]MBN9214487.1 type II secretion system F family protein [Microbacterium sp.]ODT40727.1 MAG: type II secretion protein F [Microbacterium sp. SCN 70-200]OJV83724.1 MAG: type II secretion protein F [Microbacterium sp. 70-16]
MTLVWGALLAAGVLLTVSPWLWPSTARVARPRAGGRLDRLLQEAGYAHAPGSRLGFVAALSAVVAAAVAWLATGLPVVAVVAAVAGAVAPFSWLRARARRLRRSRRALWSDVCDLLVSAVRAGMSLPDAVAALAMSGPPALRPAFTAFGADMAASGHFDSSALRLKATLADPVADRIIETLRMARHVGGTELVGVLRALSASVRADAALRAEVEARQSWVRGAAVVGVVAPWIVLGLLSMRPEGAAAYATASGVVVVLVGAGVSVVAYRLTIRLGRLPEPQRWFG